MAKVRIPVAGTVGKAVRINTDATVGGKIGVDIKLPSGIVPTFKELAIALNAQLPLLPTTSAAAVAAPTGTVFESQIVDGNILARVAANETISGLWEHSGRIKISANAVGGVRGSSLSLFSSNTQFTMENTIAPVDAKAWNWIISGSQLKLRLLNDAYTGVADFLTFTRSGTAPTSLDVNAALTAISYGGILEANLTDKTSAEVITGPWAITQYFIGDISMELITIGTGLWHRPGGFSAFVNEMSIGSPPTASDGYYHLLGNRDVSNGYGALWQDFDTGRLFSGFSLTQADPTWIELLDTVGAQIKTAGSLTFNDNVSLHFGDTDDVDMSFDGLDFNMVLPPGGDFRIFTENGTEAGFTVLANGANLLFYDGALRLGTSSAGVNVTGDFSATDIVMETASRYRTKTIGGVRTTILEFNASDVVKLGHLSHVTDIIGSSVTVNGAPIDGGLDPAAAEVITGGWTYDGVLAANLLDKTAAETISGLYTFQNRIDLSHSLPRIRFFETDASLDNKLWELMASGGQFVFRVQNDATSVSANIITVDRTGTVIDAVNVLAPLTATSYDGILAANLLDKSVGELITAAWTFNEPIALNESSFPGFKINAINPGFVLNETDAPVDEKIWRFIAQGGKFSIQSRSDADAFGATIFAVSRTGTVIDNITLAATTVQVNGALTATSYDGVLAANLLDKAAVESISASKWTFNSLEMSGEVPVPSGSLGVVIGGRISTATAWDNRVPGLVTAHNTGGPIAGALAGDLVLIPRTSIAGSIHFATGSPSPVKRMTVTDAGLEVFGQLTASDATAPRMRLLEGTVLRSFWEYTAANGARLDSDGPLKLAANNTVAISIGNTQIADFVKGPTKSGLAIPYYVTAGFVGGKISAQSAEPSNPERGDLWFDTT